MNSEYKRYLNMPDNRPRDSWNKPIGHSYMDKLWDELTPDEMIADFEWKSDILDSFGEEVSAATFYQDYLFRELYAGELPEDYKVLLIEYDADNKKKVHKVDVDEIEDYLHLNDVALSPCLYHRNWKRKDLLNYVTAFVLDIDKLRPQDLQNFFKLFHEGRLLVPTFIANSGSGVHFYYVLDNMLRVDSVQNEASKLISEEIYKRLYDDVIIKERYRDAQRHWIGQDYRVINSKTKLKQTSQIFKTGEFYTIEQLIKHYDVKIDREKHYASKKMVSYASGIAKNLQIDPPDFSNAKETYEFIKQNKDAAYLIREEQRKKREEKNKKKGKQKPKKPGTWYKNTLYYMRDNTTAGHRFSAMKALAKIAYLERFKISRETFMKDLDELAAYWSASDWKGDTFNTNNVKDIKRFYDNAEKYKTTPETLEEWLGFKFSRVGTKRREKPLKQKVHLKLARNQLALMKEIGITSQGRHSAEQIVREWQQAHSDGKKVDCIRDTGLSKTTVYKWWSKE